MFFSDVLLDPSLDGFVGGFGRLAASSYNTACSQFFERALRAGCAWMTQTEIHHLSLFVGLDLGTPMARCDGIYISSERQKNSLYVRSVLKR